MYTHTPAQAHIHAYWWALCCTCPKMHRPTHWYAFTCMCHYRGRCNHRRRHGAVFGRWVEINFVNQYLWMTFFKEKFPFSRLKFHVFQIFPIFFRFSLSFLLYCVWNVIYDPFFTRKPPISDRGVTSFPWALVQGSRMGPYFYFQGSCSVFLQYSKKVMSWPSCMHF